MFFVASAVCSGGEAGEEMSLSPEPVGARLTGRLTEPRIRELAALILKCEHPLPSRALIGPLLELVRARAGLRAAGAEILLCVTCVPHSVVFFSLGRCIRRLFPKSYHN